MSKKVLVTLKPVYKDIICSLLDRQSLQWRAVHVYGALHTIHDRLFRTIPLSPLLLIIKTAYQEETKRNQLTVGSSAFLDFCSQLEVLSEKIEQGLFHDATNTSILSYEILEGEFSEEFSSQITTPYLPVISSDCISDRE